GLLSNGCVPVLEFEAGRDAETGAGVIFGAGACDGVCGKSSVLWMRASNWGGGDSGVSASVSSSRRDSHCKAQTTASSSLPKSECALAISSGDKRPSVYSAINMSFL